jgi:hypothetical protein
MHKLLLRAVKLSATVWAASGDTRMEQGFDIAIARLQKISLRLDNFAIDASSLKQKPVILNDIEIHAWVRLRACRIHGANQKAL